MGTSNFHTANADKTYVVCDYEWDDDNGWMWEECKENLLSDLIVHLRTFTADKDIKSEDELRSFPTISLGSTYQSVVLMDVGVTITANIFMRSGYYEAACLDWELNIEGSAGDNYCSMEAFIEDLLSHLEGNEKEELRALETNLITEVEKAFAKVSTPYNLIGSASNGEAFYGKATS